MITAGGQPSPADLELLARDAYAVYGTALSAGLGEMDAVPQKAWADLPEADRRAWIRVATVVADRIRQP